MSISLEQEIAAQAAVASLDAKINLARVLVTAGTWVPGSGGYEGGQVALSAIDRIKTAVDDTLAGPYLQKAINGQISWEDWVTAADGYGDDLNYIVSNTGISAELANLRQVPGDVETTVSDGIDKAKDVAPFVAAGVGAFAALVIALVVIWELR